MKGNGSELENMADDAILLERIEAGEREAFDALISKYQREIYFLALRMLKNAEDAEEMAQKTFVTAFQKVTTFEGRSSFRTWLYQVCINMCKTFLKRRKTVVELSDYMVQDGEPEDTPLSGLVKSEMAKQAADAVGELPEKQKMAVTLRIFHEMGFREIGEVVGCTENAAKVNFHYGMDTLRKRLNKDGIL